MEKLVEGGFGKRPFWTILDYLLGQWFVAGIGIAIGLAAAFPKVGTSGAFSHEKC